MQGNKKCAREQKMCFCGTLGYLFVAFALYGLLWICMALCGLMWSRVVFYGLMALWPRIVLLLFTAMTMCGLIRLSVALWDLGVFHVFHVS